MKVSSPEEAPIVAPTRMTRTKTRAMAKASHKDPPKTPPAEKSRNDSEQDAELPAASLPKRPPVLSHGKQKFGTPVSKTAYLSHSQLLVRFSILSTSLSSIRIRIISLLHNTHEMLV